MTPESTIGRRAVSTRTPLSAKILSWTRLRTARLLAAIHRSDGPAVVTVLTGDGRDLLESMPQLAGDGLLCALARQLPAAQQLAAEVVAILRHRNWDGDAELADQLDPASSDSGRVSLRPLPVDLEQLAAVLEGDRREGGGRIDLTTCEAWPQVAFEDEDEDDNEDGDPRWLWVESDGSRASYHDMAEFITTIPDPDLADRLERAIHGKGAFGRFKDQLAHHPATFDRWFRFSAERQRGRARQWLADNG